MKLNSEKKLFGHKVSPQGKLLFSLGVYLKLSYFHLSFPVSFCSSSLFVQIFTGPKDVYDFESQLSMMLYYGIRIKRLLMENFIL